MYYCSIKNWGQNWGPPSKVDTPLGGEVSQISIILKYFITTQVTRLGREQNRKVLLKEYGAKKVPTNKNGALWLWLARSEIKTVSHANGRVKGKHKASKFILLASKSEEFILRQIPLRRRLWRNIFQFTISLLVILGTPLAALLKNVSSIKKNYETFKDWICWKSQLFFKDSLE